MVAKTCECGCGRQFEIEDGPRSGRPRRYYERACRKRAQRNREENARWVKASEGEIHIDTSPPSTQIANAVLELGNIAGAFRRLAIEEPNPRLSAGSERVYLDIISSLDRNFPGWRP